MQDFWETVQCGLLSQGDIIYIYSNTEMKAIFKSKPKLELNGIL